MKKRGWVVPLVTEFYPPNTCLLGLNVGGGGGEGQGAVTLSIRL
jgi:hypothetical protein